MIRYNYIYKDWSKAFRGNGKLDFDTGAVGARPAGKRWTGSFQYRFYFYEGGSTTQFLQHTWPGYRITGNCEVRAALNKVPVGLLPYASNAGNLYVASLSYELPVSATDATTRFCPRPLPTGWPPAGPETTGTGVTT